MARQANTEKKSRNLQLAKSNRPGVRQCADLPGLGKRPSKGACAGRLIHGRVLRAIAHLAKKTWLFPYGVNSACPIASKS